MKHPLIATFALLVLPTIAQKPTWSEPPKLVVGIVVDQMRTDYIYRYWDNFGPGGFKRLATGGAFLRDAHFDHTPTETGPGHATVYTGTIPARHGVVANEMIDRVTGERVYCMTAADSVQAVGMDSLAGRKSPAVLLASTLADELERRFDGRSKTIGIAFKDRSAILPIGRTGDAAYWFASGPGGGFGTSTWYMDVLPEWLGRFNGEGLANAYLGRTWDLLLPREKYHTPLQDQNDFEAPVPGTNVATLPLDLRAIRNKTGSTSVLAYTPWGNTLTTDLALAAISGEELGTDAATDLLAVSYSSTDLLAHKMGIRALEVEDMYLRLDEDIARLLNELDQRVGANNYLVFLTGDHAAGDVPAYLRAEHGSAGYVDVPGLQRRLSAALTKRFGTGAWVRTIANDQVFLDEALISARKLDLPVVERAAADHLLTEPLIAEALTAADLVSTSYDEGLRRSMQRGFMPQRSGHVLFAHRPGYAEHYTEGVEKGTTHGSGWNYDTHVPILFYGQGIRPGGVLRRTSITDIAPTIAMIIGMSPPDASSGVVVTEALLR